jgi:uncharacterized protein YggE
MRPADRHARSLFPVALAALALAVLGDMGRVAAQEDRGEPGRLTVVGEGEARAAPDMAVLTLGVISQADTAEAALAENTRRMTGIIEAVKAAGIAPRDIQTSGFSVEPTYNQPDPRSPEPFQPEIVGYTVRNNVMVQIRNLQDAGGLLDRVVRLGSNAVSGLAFTVADPKPLQDRARRNAVADAAAKARLYADAAGVALGPILSIDERRQEFPVPMMARAEMAQASADMAVPIEAGEIAFSADIVITWGIAD